MPMPSRGQHQLRAVAARDAQRIQQSLLHGHASRVTVPSTDATGWLAVCEAVAGWQQEMARRLNRYSGPLLADATRPMAQGLALAGTRMLLAMQQKNRHLVLDSIPVMRLPAVLCLAEHLERLTIHDCDLFEWPASGGLPVNLSVLHFSRNQRLTALPGRIGMLLQLQEIVVLDSPLRALPSSLSQLPRLERLVLQGTDLRIVPGELGALERLNTLTLASNRHLLQLPISLGQLAQLRQLNLCGNPVLAELPDTLCNLAMLERLDLRDNRAMAALPTSLGRLHRLRYLDGSGMSALAALPESIGNCAALRTLRLRDCASLRALPPSVGSLKRLTHLDLRGCNALADLPDTLRDLSLTCRIDVPAHLFSRLAALRAAAAQPAAVASSTSPDWTPLRTSWRARLRPYDAEYGSDALRIWIERYISAIAFDAVRAHRDSRRLSLLVDGLCDSTVLRSHVFQRAYELYALGNLDDDGLPLSALMTLLINERLRERALPEDEAVRMLRTEAFAALLEHGTGGSPIDDAIHQFAHWAPLQG
ncbi:leucine-rich repeat domain-containing protein [Ralstonia sp. A12]|uniref:leucine-rich repeat domain-containing protein n=1 Tax=Ralstonia sp. A12 TaxID=1217052 RepID=UPI0012ED8416|nr:leucine-rich repeat domain-containing protein [Ralstonia sp. A12]